jgi:hypothetical protein
MVLAKDRVDILMINFVFINDRLNIIDVYIFSFGRFLVTTCLLVADKPFSHLMFDSTN